MEANTDVREEEGGDARWGEEERKRGGTIGGTYCQVGPRGVARVAPLSDNTHRRKVGRTLAVGTRRRREGKQRRRGETRDQAGGILDSLIGRESYERTQQRVDPMNKVDLKPDPSSMSHIVQE